MKYLEQYQSYRADTISIRKITKGNNSAKNVVGVTVPYLCTSSGHALYFYQVLWNYLNWYQSYRADTISILKITKGNNSAKNVGGVTVVNLCTSSGHALYFYQVLWNYLKRYQSYRADTISIRKISKGNNSAKNVGGVTVVDLCTSSGHALYFYQVLWNYLKRYQSYRADTISILTITKGNNSAKNVGGMTVVDLCTSSGHALYFYQVSWNYLERYQSYGPDTNVQPLTDGQTVNQKFGGYNIIPRHFLWRGIKRWQRTRRRQKDGKKTRKMAKRPRIIGKRRPEIWQKDAEWYLKDGKKTRKDGNEMAIGPGTILIRLQKAQERYPLIYSVLFYVLCFYSSLWVSHSGTHHWNKIQSTLIQRHNVNDD